VMKQFSRIRRDNIKGSNQWMFMYSADQNPTKGLHEVGAILAESVPIEQTPDVRFTGISYGRLGTEEELMAMQRILVLRGWLQMSEAQEEGQRDTAGLRKTRSRPSKRGDTTSQACFVRPSHVT